MSFAKVNYCKGVHFRSNGTYQLWIITWDGEKCYSPVFYQKAFVICSLFWFSLWSTKVIEGCRWIFPKQGCNCLQLGKDAVGGNKENKGRLHKLDPPCLLALLSSHSFISTVKVLSTSPHPEIHPSIHKTIV